MTGQFSPAVSKILSFSKEEALRLESPFVGPEHILIAMLREKDGAINSLFEHNKINKQAIKYNLEERLRLNDFVPTDHREVVLNPQASNILKLAALEARMQKAEIVDTEHLLLAILHDRANNGAKII